ncbi:PAS domain-containing protein [Sphingomonas sp. BIUV-7]|uniref:histidine kinase n=1 Tax=Sphingomonas natans TaxID=3063330 RepID=A0ABT8YAL3_9SPHN|nr:PAS domain-containing protein [Sphingomonas sp. BIUV-7]MDO6414690.1 PAS domain-containing protein [Sphingomonas sp. BIUV-7]
MPGSLGFLAGGGEMGARIRAHAWSDTPLGPPEGWSQALRIVVRFLLDTRHPTNILWGEQAIWLYNDAYRVSLDGDRHANGLGSPAHDVWGEIWPLIGPQIDQVMAGGEGTFHEDQAMHVTKDGRLREEYWTYSLSPVDDEEADGVGGILVICTETTEQVLGARRLIEQNEKRYALFQRLPGFVGILRGPDHVYEYVNDSYRAFAGSRDLIGHPVREQFPELHGQGFFELLDGVYATGEPIVLHSSPIRLAGEDHDRYIDLRYDPIYDDSGAITGIFVGGYDLTDRVRAEARREALADFSERVRHLATAPDIAFAASELIGRTLGVSRAGYGTIDAVAETLCVERDWNAPGIAPLPPIVQLRDYGSFIDDLKRGAEITIPDVRLDVRTAALAPAFEAQSVRAFANVPVIEHGTLVAVLYLNHVTVRHWPDDDIAFIREFAERTRTAVERNRSEEALRALTASLEQQVEERTRERDRLWETSEDLLVTAGYHGELFRVSPSWTRNLGYDEQTLLAGSYMDFVHPDDAANVVARMTEMLESGQPTRFQNRVMASDGKWRTIAWSLAPDPDGRRLNAVGRDITGEIESDETRAILEEQLRQSQKMEAVGQLTGGIAHDFNNMIQGITGSLQIATRRLAQGRTDEIDSFMARAITSAGRAAALTHRLLAFSRRQPLDPRSVDANALVVSLADMFRRTIGERIILQLVQAPGLWKTLCDPNQLESALLNLVINARDAMPNGGTLTIETRNAELDKDYVRRLADVRPGQYVCVSVCDTGTGMSPETISRAFDPFFTTKAIGQGTGLGLSMTYGFARQSEGFARIYSKLGEGTSVNLYLPRDVNEAEADIVQPEPVRAPVAGQGQVILVIEDDTIVRGLVVDVLTEFGYRVMQAPNGQSGLALLQSDPAIDLLLTDIGLPDLNGQQVAETARAQRPDLKVLFMTGYAETAANAAGFLQPGMALMTKPFRVEDLTIRVRSMIDA